MIFDQEEFDKWRDSKQIPQEIMDMVNFIAEKIGYGGDIEEEVINIYNRGGQVIGWAKGFTISHCTSSYEDGPSTDYSGAFKQWLAGLKFEIENSHGDNGMDWSTNWRDTYWYNDFIYTPSQVWEEFFITWEDEDYEW